MSDEFDKETMAWSHDGWRERALRLERELAEAREEHANDQRVIGLSTQRERRRIKDADSQEACIISLQAELVELRGRCHDGVHQCACGGVSTQSSSHTDLPAPRAEVEAAFRAGYLLAFMDHGGEWQAELQDAAWSRYRQEKQA